GIHPEHTSRLAAYWGEQLGGPATYTESIGDYSQVVRTHAGRLPRSWPSEGQRRRRRDRCGGRHTTGFITVSPTVAATSTRRGMAQQPPPLPRRCSSRPRVVGGRPHLPGAALPPRRRPGARHAPPNCALTNVSGAQEDATALNDFLAARRP